MSLPIKITWGTTSIGAERWHGGLFCLYKRSYTVNRRGEGDSGGVNFIIERRLALSARGLLCWGSALMVVAYIAATVLVYQWCEKRPFNLVTLEDCMLYPIRRDSIKEKQGRAFVADGLDDIRSGRVRAGMPKLSIGIARYPKETTGRLVLAKIYVLLNARAKAADILREGLPYTATDRPYMESVLKFASEGEDFDLWLDACAAGLAQTEIRPDTTAFRRWLTQRKITGLTESGAPAMALSLAESAGAETDEEFAGLKALALLKTGDANAAASFLDSWQKQNGQSHRLLPLQIRSLREAGRPTDMERMLDAWQQSTPLDTAPYINRITNCALLHDKAGAQAAADTFSLRFGSYLENILKLSEALVPLGESELSKQCIAQANAQGFATFTLRQLLMETCLNAGEWEEARSQLNALAALRAKNDPMTVYWQMTDRMINAILDPMDGAQSSLSDYLQEKPSSLIAYKHFIDVMRKAGRTKTALEIADLAQGQFPNSPEFIKIRAALTEHLAATQAAKPVVPVIKPKRIDTEQIATAARAIVVETEDEPRFFNELDAQIKTGKINEALSSIRSARETKPDWLAAREDELALLEIRLYAAQNETLTVQSFTRLYLGANRVRSAKILSLAKDLHAGGDTASAIVLAKEVLRKAPDFLPAKKLLNEWSPASQADGEPLPTSATPRP